MPGGHRCYFPRQIVIAIVLVNLLIAMMCNTFGWLNVVLLKLLFVYCFYSAEVWKNADKKWKYSRTYYQVNGNE